MRRRPAGPLQSAERIFSVVRKILATLSHLGLEVEIRHWNLFKGELRTPEYLDINTNAKAPTLVDGDFRLWESTAIMQYLAEKAAETPLFPRNPRTRADITRWQCCRQGLAVFPSQDIPRIRNFIELTVTDCQITRIRDFHHVPYFTREARIET